MKNIGISVITICFLIVNTSNAQFSKFKNNPFSNTIILSLGGGVSQSETDYTTNEMSICGSGFAEYFFSNSSDIFLGLKLEAGYANLIGNSKSIFPNKYNTDVLSFGPSASLNFQVVKNLFPYAGFGIRHLWYSDYSSFDFVPEFGIRYLLSNYFAVNVNLSLNFLSEDNLDNFEVSRSSKDFFAAFSLSFSYAVDLTVADDIDNDGIKNSADACPEQEEDFDGFEDTDGCPEFDNDKDGIVDLRDNCVNEPEDFDGFEDSDGCPDFDNDGDGIIDSEDTCPDLKEDFDGFEDADGCPELDNDKDGILDENDKCPNDAETFNNFEDSDGCPDELPKTEQKVEQSLNKIDAETNTETKVRLSIPNQFTLKADEIFDNNSATIKNSAFANLNEIVNQIKTNADFNWRIESHLDNSGTLFEMKALTTARANSILNYFVSKGIPSKNLDAVGLADEFPLAPNTTNQGKTKNRRVEIKRIR
jgi:outer membrane protein OmpA-like peptidoglycan-associated protein